MFEWIKVKLQVCGHTGHTLWSYMYWNGMIVLMRVSLIAEILPCWLRIQYLVFSHNNKTTNAKRYCHSCNGYFTRLSHLNIITNWSCNLMTCLKPWDPRTPCKTPSSAHYKPTWGLTFMPQQLFLSMWRSHTIQGWIYMAAHFIISQDHYRSSTVMIIIIFPSTCQMNC